ncbi:hypothetical protein [Spirosoma telluris]|uniref:hypothetical protein n=1 Tax=Spirosoma telluris TaxID=2183553 RepID=UPI002FC2C3D6
MPGISFDLARAGKGKSHGWFSSPATTEQASTLLEVNASQKDKDFILAVNWKSRRIPQTGERQDCPGQIRP